MPVGIATLSPYLAYRSAPYILGGFAGIVGLALLLFQPMLMAGYLPGIGAGRARLLHRLVGTAIVLAVLLHVGGLYVTSPPDTLDALLLVAPTPFSVYGVTAFWGVIVTALLVAFRRRIGLGSRGWRLAHNGLAFIVVIATVVHAVQIEGAMGTLSKWVLCLAVLGVTTVALTDLRIVRPLRRRTG